MLMLFMKGMKKNKKGFTLTELIVVVAILGVLAAVATPIVTGQIAKAKTSADNTNIRVLENTIALAIAEEVISVEADGDIDEADDSLKSKLRQRLSGQQFPTTSASTTSDLKYFYLDKSTGKVYATSATDRLELSN